MVTLRTQIWRSLVKRSNIIVGEENSGSALTDLALDDVLALGLGESTMKIRAAGGLEQGDNLESLISSGPAEAALIDQRVCQSIQSGGLNSTPGIENEGETRREHSLQPQTPDQTPTKRRRGRPPKSIAGSVGRKASVLDADTDAPLTTTIRVSTRTHRPRTFYDPNEDTPQHVTPPSTRPTHIRRAIFTSYEDLQRREDEEQRRAGVARVYIDPAGSAKPGENRKSRGKNTKIAVFKSEKLKDPQWLESRKGTWAIVLAKKRKSATAGIEDIDTYQTENEYSAAPKRLKVTYISASSSSLNPGCASLPPQAAHTASVNSPLNPDSGVQTTKRKRGRPRKTSNVENVPQSKEAVADPIPPVVLQAQNFGATSQRLYQTPYSSSQERFVQDRILQPPALSKRTQYLSPYSSIPTDHAITPNSSPYKSPYKTPYKSPYAAPYPAYKSPYEINSTTVPVCDSPYLNPAPATNRAHYIASSSIPNATVENSDLNNRTKSFSVRSPAQPALKSASSAGRSFVPPETRKRKHSDLASPEVPARSLADIKSQALVRGLTHGMANAPKPLESPDQSTMLHPSSIATTGEKTQLQDAFAKAKGVSNPKNLVRISAMYNKVIGNLFLSENKSDLTFFGIDQKPPLLPMLTIPVSKLTQNPITSMPGSNPMELRVKAKNHNDGVAIHSFRLEATDAAYAAANNMRAKLVNAMITIRFRTGNIDEELPLEIDVPNLEIVKPFKCESCGSRFKTKGGLLYHQTQSNKTCNPNFDPTRAKPKIGRKKKNNEKKLSILTRSGHLLDSGEHESEVQDYSSSEDSVFEWAERVAVPLPNRTPTVAKSATLMERTKMPTRVYRSLQAETSVLQEVIKELGTPETPQEGLIDPMENVSNSSIKNVGRSVPPWDITDPIASERGKEIVLNLVKANNGIFPGDRSLWFAFVGAWLRQYAQSSILPESKLCSKTIDGLIDSKELRSLQFSFRDGRSRVCTRHIILMAGVDLASPAIEKLKQLVKRTYPRHYLPSKFAPPEIVLSKLEAISHGGAVVGTQMVEDKLLTNIPRKRRRRYSSRETDSRRQSTTSNGGEFMIRDATVAESDEALEEYFSDSDDSYEAPIAKNDFRDGHRKEGQSRKMRDGWGTANVVGGGVLSNASEKVRLGTDSRRKRGAFGIQKVSVPLTPEEKARRAQRAALRLQSWPQALSFLPNSRNGAWDQTPLRVKKVHRKPKRRTILPEPITLMQAANGAWSIRPFGHGVRPIFARPARRADGNPHLGSYLERIENGHRPILIPTRNRLFLPAAPSKYILRNSPPPISVTDTEDMEQVGYGISTRLGVIKRRSREKTSVSASPDDPRFENQLSEGSGMPKGSHYKLNSRQSVIAASELETVDSRNYQPSRRQTRTSAKAAQALDEIQILNSFEPRKIFPGVAASRNPGLDSLPSSYGMRISKDHVQTPDLSHKFEEFEFLAPNTGLDEAIDQALIDPALQSKALPPPRLLVEPTIELRAIQFTPPESIQDDSNLEDGSWTLCSWMPDSSWFLHNNIPPNFSLHDVPAEQPECSQPTELFSDIERVAKWEQGIMQHLLSSASLAPNYRWINHSSTSLSSSFDSQQVQARWLDETTFTMETLPYDELDRHLEDTQPGGKIYQSPYTRKGGYLAPPSQKAKELRELQRFYTTRRLTALPADFEGVMHDTNAAALEFGVQVASSNTLSRPRKRFMDERMSTKTESRFIFAVVMVRTLTGGLDLQIDWVLIGALFPDFSMNFLSKNWAMLLQKKKVTIEKLVLDFQEAFLSDYGKGVIPPIDYDHLVDYNWNWLIDWAAKKLDLTIGSKEISLPGSRERLSKLYNVTEIDPESNNWRETYYGILSPIYRRMELAASVPYTKSLNPKVAVKTGHEAEIDSLALAKSWARATTITQEAAWDRQSASNKLMGLGLPLVEEALQALTSAKIIMHRAKGRPTAGRSYEATDVFLSALRKHVTESQFVEAAAFKTFLDAEIRSGKACVRSDYMANEGTLMCITSMQANGRIRLQSVGVPMKKFGLTDGGYETRKLDKSKFRFEMDIYPTESYLFDGDNEVLKRLETTEAPRGGAMGELPVWYGISNLLIPEMWLKVIAAVSGVVALRAGINVKGLRRTFNPALEEWEIRKLIDWAVGLGVFKTVQEDIEGWTVGEWWWLAVGRICSTK